MQLQKELDAAMVAKAELQVRERELSRELAEYRGQQLDVARELTQAMDELCKARGDARMFARLAQLAPTRERGVWGRGMRGGAWAMAPPQQMGAA